MSDKLWCQMCGREQEATRDGCIYDICGACGARIIRDQKPDDTFYGRYERDAIVEQLDALIEVLIEGGRELAERLDAATSSYPDNQTSWNETIAEWRKQK